MITAETKIVKEFIQNYCEKKTSQKGAFGKSTIEKYYGTYIAESSFINAVLELSIPLSKRNFVVSIKKEFQSLDFMNKPLFAGYLPAEIRLQQIQGAITIEPQMIKEIELCEKWINTIGKRTNTINRRRSSYGYKHDVERWAGQYICNDSFKIAAKSCGLMIETADRHGLNEYYNLSNK